MYILSHKSALLNFNCLQTSYTTIATELLRFKLRLSLIIGILIERFCNLLNITLGKPVVSDPKSKKISLSYFNSEYILVPYLVTAYIFFSSIESVKLL